MTEGVKYNSQRLPKASHTPMAGEDVPSVTFKEPVSSTPCVRLNPAAVVLLGVSSLETSDKETEDKDFRHYQPQLKVMKECKAKNCSPYIKNKRKSAQWLTVCS